MEGGADTSRQRRPCTRRTGCRVYPVRLACRELDRLRHGGASSMRCRENPPGLGNRQTETTDALNERG